VGRLPEGPLLAADYCELKIQNTLSANYKLQQTAAVLVLHG